MKFGLIFALAAAAFDLTCAPAQAGSKPIMVHYMPWYVTPYSGAGWGWHWTMNHFDPNTTNASGQSNIASWYYPSIGPYDSLDPDVLEYHVLLMKLAGIDGIIVDWYGMDTNVYDYGINNVRTAAIFSYAKRAGLKFSLCYEDSTIAAEISGGFLAAKDALTHAQQTMLYAQSNYFIDGSFLRLGGKPLLLNFGPQYFTTNSGWVSIFSALDAGNQPAFFTEDNRFPAGQGAFDWPPMSVSGGGTLTSNQLGGYLGAFEARGKGWPAYVSSAFPRFHDIYAQAGVRPTYGYLDDNGGITFRQSLVRAFTNDSAVVQLVTWNDFGEGTIIEPTAQYGCRDLGVVQDLRRQYIDAAFPCHTNDLALASQIYTLRRHYGASAAVAAELDRAFTNIVAGKLATASLQLAGIQSNTCVIYDVASTNRQIRFSIGGYLAGGARVDASTNLSGAGWRTVSVLSPGTNQPTFSTNAQAPAEFFKARQP